MASYTKAKGNLAKLDRRTQIAVKKLYASTSDLLKELIVDDSVALAKADALLTAELNAALESTDFVNRWKKGVTNTIVQSSYSKAGLEMSLPTYTDRLLRTSLWKDNITLSQRLRKNSRQIVAGQKQVLKESLRQGRVVNQIVKDIAGDFTGDLPKYMDDLRKASIGGQKIPPSKIRAVRRQAEKLKGDDLRVAYNKLIDAIDIGGPIDKAVSNAMVEKTNSYAQRTARTETIKSVTEVKNVEAMHDPDTQYVKNITSGSNPCNYCLSVEDIGFVPVENATLPTHHPNCSCSPQYKKTSRRPEKWSNDKHNNLVQKNIDKWNKKNPDNKTYIKPISPVNLRNNTLLDKLAD